MRGTIGLILVAAAATPVLAQNFPAEMVVVLPEVEVRSGPTKEYHPTSKLRQGEKVLALRQSKDQPGWVAVKPPAGSFSWVNARHVKQVDQRTGYVLGEGNATIPVLPGSSLVDRAPNVESVRIAPGFLVTILDRPLTVEGNTWLPIAPPPTEVRYVPLEALRPADGSSFPGGNPGVAVATIIAQGDQALKTGNVDQARQLYRQAAAQATDHQQRTYLYNRLASLDRTGWTSPGQTGSPGQTASLTKPADNWVTVQAPRWSQWGTLRRAPFERDGQPVYLLENRQGQVLAYVATTPGTSLRDYVGRMVCLYGATVYRPGDALRTHFVLASHVATP